MFRRNRLFFLLAYYTGARPVELLSLRLGSFSECRSVVRIVGAKGSGKSRSYQLGSDVQAAVSDYVRECALAGRAMELGRHFFLGSRDGARWTYAGVRKVCEQVSKRIGFRVTAYMLRRLVASELFERSLPIQDIQHHLGHMRASTTLRYVQSHHHMNRRGVSVMSGLIAGSGHLSLAHGVQRPSGEGAVPSSSPGDGWSSRGR